MQRDSAMFHFFTASPGARTAAAQKKRVVVSLLLPGSLEVEIGCCWPNRKEICGRCIRAAHLVPSIRMRSFHSIFGCLQLNE